MALITLKDIGKIYVSGSNVSVGIRGVNLSFDKGEFVAITGQSGSGKSTLLNVISGMDTYEEGEMLVNGEPTSHYVQQDWEEYRKKYISFIFQEYNIIENFTVLQNVELALMHIASLKQRRARAVELLLRVGLGSHLHHKGSKLSGGQKQRTVIARALAKDSPIILADEPTGNLDSQTSKEIIQLLREVSKDKLVIVVTHNFDQVKDYATRHVRVFDGAIESDHVISRPQEAPAAMKIATEDIVSTNKVADTVKRYGRNLRNGMSLGRVRFTSMPKLSAFLCVLMVVTSLIVTLITSIFGDAFSIFDKNYVFTHMDGRTVIARQDGAVISDAELAEVAEKTDADSYMHYDFLLDWNEKSIDLPNVRGYSTVVYISVNYDKFDSIDVGRAPASAGEAILRLPLYMKGDLDFDSDKGLVLQNFFGITDYLITGIDYFYDNTKSAEIVFTEEGYRIAAALAYFANSLSSLSASVEIEDNGNEPQKRTVSLAGKDIFVSYDIDDAVYYIGSEAYLADLKYFEEQKEANDEDYDYRISAKLSGSFVSYQMSDYYSYGDGNYTYGEKVAVSFPLDDYSTLSELPPSVANTMKAKNRFMLLSPKIISDFMYSVYYAGSYTQASLFYANDFRANSAAGDLRTMGYIAIPSGTEMADDSTDSVLRVLMVIPAILIWALAVLFVTIFVSFCSSRSMQSTKGDIAILRSMGVSTPVIKISIYIQMLITLIPAYLITAIVTASIFMIPQTNGAFVFLHAGAYIAIAAALFVVCLLAAGRHAKKMFKSSVKKTLKGDIGHD